MTLGCVQRVWVNQQELLMPIVQQQNETEGKERENEREFFLQLEKPFSKEVLYKKE